MLQDVPAPPSGAAMCLPAIAVDQCTQLVPPTIGCLLGLTAIADEVSERWITARRDREVMQRWLGRIIERNNEGQIARFCIHREARLGFHDAGSITRHQPDTGDCVRRRRLALEYQPPTQARPSSSRLYAVT